ncbi:MAG: hypothetical protein RL141_839 [Candidatus Parcubacteria bacterium]|jgi:FMN phosphatase YigB (HAD superfamily)
MNTNTSRWIFDFDRTLYDTEQLFGLVRDALIGQGYPAEEVDAARAQTRAGEGYTFEGHLKLLGMPLEDMPQNIERFYGYMADGNQFLLPGAADTIAQLARTSSCDILTFGHPDIQRAKVAGATSLRPSIREAHYVWKDRTKGEVIQQMGEGAIFFVDDTVEQLLDVHKKAPWVTLIRMMWPQFNAEPHPEDDKLWRVIRNMEALLT